MISESSKPTRRELLIRLGIQIVASYIVGFYWHLCPGPGRNFPFEGWQWYQVTTFLWINAAYIYLCGANLNRVFFLPSISESLLSRLCSSPENRLRIEQDAHGLWAAKLTARGGEYRAESYILESALNALETAMKMRHAARLASARG